LRRLLSLVSRVAFAATLGLVLLALLRLSPVAAEPPLDVRALRLALPLVAFAVATALLGGARRPRRLLPIVTAFLVAAILLAAVVLWRGPAGIAGDVSDGASIVGRTRAGSVEVTGRDLADLPLGRRTSLRFSGELRAPVSGRYVLWVEGRGRVGVALGGRTVLQAEGDPLRAETAIGLAAGPTPLEIVFDHTGQGPRLRLGWTRPDGRREPIPARYLGAARPAWLWRLTDGMALVAAALAGVLAFLVPWDVPRAPPLPRPISRGEVGWSAVGYLALLALMSWPLVLDLAHTGPMDRPDGRLNAWILAWAGTMLFEDPARLFDAPAFHPLKDALAFSENLLLPAALVAPLQRASGPVLAYNAALLGSLLLSGLAVQLLVRRATGDRLAAFVAGAFFAAGPHRWTRLAHLHAQVTVFFPLALLALDRFWESRTLKRALVVGLMLALQGLSSVYLGAITATALGVAVLVALFGGLRVRELGRLAASMLLAGALLWPVTAPYLRMRSFQGQEFTLETVTTYAATLPSYVAAGTQLWGPLSQRLLDPTTIRDTLFPGLCVLVLGIAGLASAPKRFRAVAVAASAVAVLFSLGPETAFYRFLHEHLVLVRGVRALARFALVPTLALSVLAGVALAGRRRLAVLAALGLMLLESANLPLRLERYDGPGEAARWLEGQDGAVLVLPLAENDTLAMLDGLAHGRPLVNGDSGFIPRPFDRAMELLEHGLDAEGLRFLRAVGVRHVVTPPAAAEPPAGCRVVASFARERVLELEEGAAARVVAAGEPVPTRFSPDWTVLTLPEGRRVGRVAFELSDAAWLAQPSVEASLDGTSWERLAARASLADATLSLYRDPRHARGELRFEAREAAFLRLDARLPARGSAFEVGE
jgi:PA14 domain